MSNDANKEEINLKHTKEFKLLNSKITAMSGYLIAMRSENMRESKRTESILKTLIRQTHDIRGGLWGCLVTIWFVAILLINKNL